MQPESSPSVATSSASPAMSTTNQVRGSDPWTAEFVVAQPAAMPSERMQARAELVQWVTNCGSY